MADDLSSTDIGPRGVDLVAGAVGGFVRGLSTPQSTGAKTASFTTPGVELGGRGDLRLDLVVTAASGTTPSMTITIQTSFDNGATDAWRTVAAFPAVTATGTTRQTFGSIDRWVRASAVITGTTPSFTASLSGEAV